ncbi:hypothetical protein JCM9279_004495 [Rhodotorula babjevae]
MAQRFKPPTTAQRTEQDVTLQTSLQQVKVRTKPSWSYSEYIADAPSAPKVLLEAGIGCVAFLRGLLPEDSFEDFKLLAPRPPASRTSSSKAMTDDDKAKSNAASSVRVKKLKRGASVEADKLLDYLELGATEAIEKGYLHQLVFAIYLDPDQPTNLVESYTFTFTYETDAEGNKRPELVVQDQLSGLVISSTTNLASTEAPRKEGDVKRQVQQMIKNLITSTQVLDELPRRRFLNVRLFYTKETPASYEPPHFRPVPADAPGYILATPSVADPPDFGTLGNVSTGFHGIALHSVSIAHLLDTPFDDRISLDEALKRNRFDAASRPVVWNAESLAMSATDADDKLKVVEPVAVRDARGGLHTIQEVSEADDEVMEELRKKVGIEMREEAVIAGKGMADETLLDSNLSDNTVLRRAIASTEKRAPSAGVAPTQLDPVTSRQKSMHPPIPLFDESAAQYQHRLSSASHVQQHVAASPVMAKETHDKPAHGPSPPAETQLFEYSPMDVDGAVKHDQDDSTTFEAEPDTIKTLETGAAAQQSASDKTERPRRKGTRSKMKTPDDACECGDKDEDGGMMCCSTCEVWKHTTCYGYDSADDSRIPDTFVCYRCLAHKALDGAAFEPDKEGEIEQALAEFRSLALYRRAVSCVWSEGVLTMPQLAKRLGIDNSTAAQVIKRLKAEEYMLEQAAPQRRSRAKNASQVGSAKVGSLVANKTAKQLKRKNADYFDPGTGAEVGVAGILHPAEADEGNVPSKMARITSSPAGACELTLRPQDPLITTSTDKTRLPAVLVDDTPSSADQSQPQPLAFGGAPHPAASQPDPILDDSQPLPFSFTTPDSIASLDSTHAQRPNLTSTKRYSMQERLDDPPASYVPTPAGATGKVKVTAIKGDEVEQVRRLMQLDAHDEQVSDSRTQQPVSMDLDENDSTDLPPASAPHVPPKDEARALKRRSTADGDADAGQLGTSALASSKRQRCSEASEIEV